MEAELVAKAGLPYESIPAAGVHGVGLRALPGNVSRLGRGFLAARRILRQFRPQALFFTGGYVAVPMALAGWRVPTALYVPDIEPGLALKMLSRFADRIALTAPESRAFFSRRARLKVTGYPVRGDVLAWERSAALDALDLRADLPTLLVFGGSKGARSINRALFPVLEELLPTMQIVHISGRANWEEAQQKLKTLPAELAARYHTYPYLHAEMGAALRAADLVLFRAGASTLGEFPLFGLPAVLVPYPYAWRYQKINAEYLARRGAAVILPDAELPERLVAVVRALMDDDERRARMSAAMRELAQPHAAAEIAEMLVGLAADTVERNKP